jgi:hypothetical protein
VLVRAIQEAGRDGGNGAGRDGDRDSIGYRAASERGVPFVAALRTFGLLAAAEMAEGEEAWDEG